jgi:hypothetical protein
MLLRRIPGRKLEEKAEDWRKLYNKELHNLLNSPHVLRVTREHITHKILVGNIGGMGPFGDIGVDGMVI